MTPVESLLWECWDDVDFLLAEALDHPPERRAEFVRRHAVDDEQLRNIVLRLLDRLITSEGKTSGPSERIVRAAFLAPETHGGPDELAPGDEVGRYRLTGRLGRGGMATVYAAERSDGAYEQRVAVKVLRRGLDTEDLVRRFFMERQILSSLSHPSIARILDGGSTGDGRPYLVMELVEGDPVTKWADDRRLDVAARLRLFLDIADAVHDAHRQLVVHRDIKPSNTIVDAAGRVKLLDFGIAKILGGDGTHTEIGARPLTRDYASPEQLTGGQITTATDVYQLGLLLREMLTGVRPVAGDTEPGEPPLRPSRAARAVVRGSAAPERRAERRGATPDLLARQLGGDLDLIVGKALRPDPQERYASADELSTDVRQHLRGLPISAHPESARYRARKFVGRHPMFIPVTAAVVLGIVFFLATLARQNQRLERERDVAAAASRLSQETQTFFLDLFHSADPFAPADADRGRKITVVEALHLGAERVRQELEQQPELRAAMLSTIGALFARLDQAQPAGEVIDEAVELRMSIGDTISQEFSDDLAVLGSLLSGRNRNDSARTVLSRRLRLERGRDPPVPERVSNALLGLALATSGLDPIASADLTEEAVAVLRTAGSEEIGSALRLLADAYRLVGRWEESEAAAREALAFFERKQGPRSASTAMAAHTLGQTLGSRDQVEEAAVLIRRAIQILDQRLGRDHVYTLSMRNNLAVLFTKSESYVEAEALYRDVLAGRLARFGSEHSDVAGTYQNLAVVVAGQGRFSEADELARRAEEMYRRVLPDSYIAAFPMLTRAEILLRGGDAGGAARAAGRAGELLRGRVPANHPAAIMADCRLGRARAAMGDAPSARSLLGSAVRRLETAENVRASHVAECRTALAELGGPQSIAR